MEPKKGSANPRPGDRGDESNRAGISSIKSGYAGNLKGEASKGYDEVSVGWVGNVKR